MQLKKFSLFHFPLFLLLASLVAACASPAVQPDENRENVKPEQAAEQAGKSLVVYYSYHGTTRRAAEVLARMLDADIYELRPENPYTGDDNEVSDRVFQERDDGQDPALAGTLPAVSEYDTIFIGTPVWNADMANPVMSYLHQTDFENKRVAPFWTYQTDEGSTDASFQKEARDAQVMKGLGLRNAGSMSEQELETAFTDWIVSFPV